MDDEPKGLPAILANAANLTGNPETKAEFARLAEAIDRPGILLRVAQAIEDAQFGLGHVANKPPQTQ